MRNAVGNPWVQNVGSNILTIMLVAIIGWIIIAKRYEDSRAFCIVLRFPSADLRLHEILFAKP